MLRNTAAASCKMQQPPRSPRQPAPRHNRNATCHGLHIVINSWSPAQQQQLARCRRQTARHLKDIWPRSIAQTSKWQRPYMQVLELSTHACETSISTRCQHCSADKPQPMCRQARQQRMHGASQARTQRRLQALSPCSHPQHTTVCIPPKKSSGSTARIKCQRPEMTHMFQEQSPCSNTQQGTQHAPHQE
jgi:hypothetical protein